MSESFNNSGLSAEELKSQLYQSLHSSGLLKKLKGELRQSMINELRGKNDKKRNKKDLLGPTIQRKSRSWLHQAVDNLVYLHLKQSRYQYSLSLFQQESSVESYSPSLTEDLLQRLGLGSRDFDISTVTPSSSMSESVDADASSSPGQEQQTSVIWKIFDQLSTLAATQTSTPRGKVKFASFNSEEKSPSLGEKLRAIDNEMNPRTSSCASRDPAIAVSSYTAAVRRAEEDAERRAKSAFEQWKSVDLLQMKMEESKKAKDLEKLKAAATHEKTTRNKMKAAFYDLVYARMKQLEDDYQSKLSALQERERAAISRLSNQKEIHEKEMHEQRQHLLREIDQLRIREEALHKQETLVHETELLKRNELKLVRDQIAQTQQKETKSKGATFSMEQYSAEIEDLRRQLREKAAQFESTKRELCSLQAGMSTATCQQFQRENVLRNQLEQFLSRDQGHKPLINDSPKVCKPMEKLQEEIKRLKKENDEKDIQQRTLALTLKEVQQALEDSTAALTRLGPQGPHVTFADPDPDPSYVRRIMSSYSPSPKRDKLREYEPVQTSLHPAVVSSCDYDEPSMDASVASVGIRVDLQQRFKDLERQTMEVDEQYQRYLNTNYRELMQAQSQARTDQGSPQSKPHPHASSIRKSPKMNFAKDRDIGRPEQKLDFFGLEDPVEAVRRTTVHDGLARRDPLFDDSPSNNDLQPEEPVKDFSYSSLSRPLKNDFGSENFPERLVASTEEQLAPLQSRRDSPFKQNGSALGEVTSQPSPLANVVTPDKETEMGPASNEQSGRHLPPVTAPRKLPTLPRSDIQAPRSKPNLDGSGSDDDDESSRRPEVKSRPSHPKTDDDSRSSEDQSSKSDLLSTKNRQFNFTTEIALPSRSQNVPVDQIEVASSAEKSDVTRSPEFSLSSQSRDQDRGRSQVAADDKKKGTSPPQSLSIENENEARQRGGFTTEESSISEKIVEPAPRKSFDDFDPSNDNDIAAALRWGDKNQRSLVESNDEIFSIKKPESEPEVEDVQEEREVFEMSEDEASIDSLESKRKSVEDKYSDVSW